MPLNKTCQGLIIDLAKYALRDVKQAERSLSECETELAEMVEATVREFIAGLSETEDD